MKSIQQMGNFLGGAFPLSIANQALSSGTNFLVGVYLARTLGPSQFGIYGIGFSVILLFATLCAALFTTQLIVRLPSKRLRERPAYVVHVLRLIGILSGLFVVAASLTGLFWTGEWHSSEVFIFIGVGAGSYVVKEFFLRLSFSWNRIAIAVVVNFTISVALLAGFSGLSVFAVLDASTALGVFAGAQLVGCAIAIFIYSRVLALGSITRRQVPPPLTWADGKWSLAGAVVNWSQSQAYIYVLAITVGPAGVGYANSAKLLISPFLFLSPAVSQIMLPYLASKRRAGFAPIYVSAKKYSSSMLTAAIIYLAMLFIVFEPITEIVLGPKYDGIQMIATAWSLLLLAQVVREGASVSLQALLEFKAIFSKNLLSALVAILMAIALSTAFGASGAVFALALAEVILAALLWRHLTKVSLVEGYSQ